MSFLAEAAALVRAKAGAVGDDADYESIDLAAHAFALATYLQERHGSGSLDTGVPAPMSKPRAIAALAAVRPRTAEELYWALVSALIAVDRDTVADARELRRRPAAAHLVPPATILEPLDDDGRPALRGVVRHWIRPVSRLAQLRRERCDDAPHVNVDPDLPAAHLVRLAMLWDRGEAIEVVPARGHESLVEPSCAEAFRIALCPLSDAFGPRFTITDGGRGFHADPDAGITPRGELEAHLDAIFADCRGHGAHLVVLPELCVDEPARRSLHDRMSGSPTLVGVIAGSFHVWRDGAALPVNEAEILAPAGPVWRHRKRGRFHLTPAQVRASARMFGPLPDELAPEIVEGIAHGTKLEILDTEIGRLAVIVCADAISTWGYEPALERARPDLVFVVSMSRKTDAFQTFADRMARFGVSTLFVNARIVCGEGDDLAFVRLAFPELQGAPPTRVRWRRADPELLSYAYHGAARGWLSAAPGPGLRLLGAGRGVLFDLARHWNYRC